VSKPLTINAGEAGSNQRSDALFAESFLEEGDDFSVEVAMKGGSIKVCRVGTNLRCLLRQ
jgi:hypothetical protein